MPQFLKKIILSLYHRFMIAKMEADLRKEFDRRIQEFTETIKHDVSVPIDELEPRVLQEASRLRLVLKEEYDKKLSELLRL